MSRFTRTAFVLGAHAPTIGGIAIHVQRLATLLAASGWKVEIFDFYTRHATPACAGAAYALWNGPVWRVLGWAVARAVAIRPAVFHVHISAAGKLVMLTLLVSLLSLLSTVIITIHSGGFPAEVRQLSPFRRRLLAFILRRCRSIVAVNDQIARTVHDLVPHRDVRVIHGFLRPSGIEPSSAGDGAQRSAQRRVALACGYATPTYDWLTLLDACRELPELDELHAVFYNDYPEPYFSTVQERIREAGGRVSLHRDLTQPEFLALLASVNVFVRPTVTDGDSLAVREALLMGLHVVASNAVPRPEGCQLFRTADAADLRRAIREALGSQSERRPAQGDAGSHLVGLYEDLGGSPP